jgi:hypothetical protein
MDSKTKAISRSKDKFITFKFGINSSKRRACFFCGGTKNNLNDSISQCTYSNFNSGTFTYLWNRREIIGINAIDMSLGTSTLKFLDMAISRQVDFNQFIRQ